MAVQQQDPLERARAAKTVALKLFAGLLGDDVAVGVTRINGEYGLKVNLQHAPPSSLVLPNAVDGVPCFLEFAGPIKKRTEK